MFVKEEEDEQNEKVRGCEKGAEERRRRAKLRAGPDGTYAGATSDTIAELMGFASSQQVIRRYMPKTVTDKRELMKKMFGE